MLTNNLPQYKCKPDYQGVNSEQSQGFKFWKVHIQEVYDFILVLKKSKSTGHDRLSMKSIEEMPQVKLFT